MRYAYYTLGVDWRLAWRWTVKTLLKLPRLNKALAIQAIQP
ncbi:MAG: hypothetical protein JWM30_212 [Burkholderia sp.]|jgi:hypothetical protein|nr:hypothetical protein [Burkholderia sp.]